VWAILYHFKNKHQDSEVYEEFKSIIKRNSLNKFSGHELFNEFYKRLERQGKKERKLIKQTQFDEKSGWPVDIVIKTRDK